MTATRVWRWALTLLAGLFLIPLGVGPACAVASPNVHVFDTAVQVYDGAVHSAQVHTSDDQQPTAASVHDWVQGSVSTAVGPLPVLLPLSVAANSALPVVEGAAPKIASLTSRYGKGIENTVLQNGTRYVDTANGGNINVFMPRPDASGFIRITLDPSGERIISAGLNTVRNVDNGIASGRFVPAS